MRKPVLILAFLVAGVIGIWVVDVYKDRHYKVTVTQTTPLYNLETDAAYANSLNKPNPTPIGHLFLGEKVVVKRTTYGKDYRALKIETPDGTVGWVAAGQKGIDIVNP